MDSQAQLMADVDFGFQAGDSWTYPTILVRNKTGDSLPINIDLTTALTGSAGQAAVLRAGDVVIKIPSGTVGIGEQAVNWTFDLLQKKYGTPGNEIEMTIDALTDNTTISTDSGYSQQTAKFTVVKVA